MKHVYNKGVAEEWADVLQLRIGIKMHGTSKLDDFA
jgi:hypothetical protein